MTAALTLPRLAYRRPLSWYAMLLLPLLPLARALFGNNPDPWVSGAVDLWQTVLLLSLGALLAFGLPSVTERLGHGVRKEAELLRPAWIGSVLLLQLTLLPWRDESGLDVMLFSATCMLLAALPFGAEFQQRTLSNLLSQPRSREFWWQLKTRTLAAALALHGLVYLLSRFAMGHRTSPLLAVGLIVAAGVAWGSAPWWTLLSRSLLAGFVFSVTAPLLTFFVTALILDATQLGDALRVGTLTGDEVSMYGLLFGALPFYAAYTGIRGYRRWLQLEASDHPTAESGAISLPSFRRQAGTARTRRPLWLQLTAKEFRVQTVTLLMGVAALVMGLASLVPLNLPKTYETMIPGGCMLLCAATIALAGATTVAEERRLGTLNPELLLPISRSFQWSIKILVALVLASLAGALLLARSPDLAIGMDITQPLTVVVILLVLFAVSLLVSTSAPNSLRAMLAAIAISVVPITIGKALVSVLDLNRWEWHGQELWWTMAADLPAWRERLQTVDPRALWARYELLSERKELLYRHLVPFVASGPILLAFLFAHRNFRRPDGPRHRVTVQLGLCCAVMLLGFLVHRGLWMFNGRQLRQAEVMVTGREFFARETRLTEAERELLRLYGTQGPTFRIRVSMRPAGVLRYFSLPLDPLERSLLIEGAADLPESLLEALREDAQRDPRPLPPAPPPPPAAAVPPTASPAPPTFRMSPELMRRYGLLPRDPKPATNLPNAIPAPQPQP